MYLLDDSWDNCTPVARAGNAAFGVYVRCGIWVARNLTDGYVPSEIATAYGSPELTRKLVDVGLWETAEGGYRVVDYLTLNPTAEKVRARRKAAAERQANWREAQKKRDETRQSHVSSRRDKRRESHPPSPPLKGEAARTTALPAPHRFTDDGSGCCAQCPLPKMNKIHNRAA